MYKTSKKTGKSIDLIGLLRSYYVNLNLCKVKTSFFFEPKYSFLTKCFKKVFRLVRIYKTQA